MISSTIRKVGPFVGNDSATVFPFAFKVFVAADLIVVRCTDGVEATLTLDSDYSVSLNADQDGNPGGSVTTSIALATGSTLIVSSSIEQLQETELANLGGFYPEVITDALDKLTILIQQMNEVLGRSIKFPITDGVEGDLPTAADRAGKYFTFTGDGSPSMADMAMDGSGIFTNFVTQKINNIYFADQYANIAAALTAAGTTGYVVIPANYTGSEAYVASNKNVIDLRGNNSFRIYQYLGASRPITGFPLGNDIAIDVDGPADLYLSHGHLGSAVLTTTTSLSAGANTNVPVTGNLAVFSDPSQAGLTVGRGTANEETVVTWSVVDSSHINLTCAKTHSGTTDIEQIGATIVEGGSGITFIPNKPASLPTRSGTVRIGNGNQTLLTFPGNASDAWPFGGIGICVPLTGMSQGTNSENTGRNLEIRNYSSSFSTRVEDSSGNVMLYFPDGLNKFISPLVSETGGGTAADAGAIRLRRGDAIEWRNNANTGNLAIAVDGSDNIFFNTANIAFNTSGQISTYRNVATAGNGIASIPGATSQKAETAVDSSLLSVTPPATVGTFRLRFVLSVSSAAAAVVGWTATWKDSNGAAQSPTNLALFQQGTAVPALTFTTSAAGNYSGETCIDIDNSATAIVVKFTLASGTVAAKASATIERLI